MQCHLPDNITAKSSLAVSHTDKGRKIYKGLQEAEKLGNPHMLVELNQQKLAKLAAILQGRKRTSLGLSGLAIVVVILSFVMIYFAQIHDSGKKDPQPIQPTSTPAK